MGYAGVEALLIPWVAARLDARGVTDLPANLADVMPLFQLVRVGGPSDDNNPRFDMPTITIDYFAADRAAAQALAESGDDLIRVTLPGQQINGSTFTRSQTITGPHWTPYDDTNLRRITSSYRLYIKSRT